MKQLPNKKKTNWWKWAFLSLVAVLVIAFAVLFNACSTSVPESTVGQSAYAKTDNSVQIDLTRQQLNALSDNYLDQFLKQSKIKYRFIVGPKYATVIGKTKFLGARVQFSLNLVPERLHNGNVLLRAAGMNVGRLNVPVGFVMGFIAKQYKLPNWVGVNAKKHTILLDLNKYSRHKQLHYSMEKIDMDNGRFQMKLSIPNNTKEIPNVP